jgi:DNA polymerase III delta prime subunit
VSEATAPYSEAALDRRRWGPLVDPALRRVAAAIARDRFPHALLFSGPPGLGRELAAVETAAMLVCSGCDEPYCESPAARRVRSGIHPDAVILRGEGKKQIIKINTIRRIVEDAPGRPFEGQCRVWVVDSVDARQLPPESANAFLKVLEEPPPHVRFVLLAANPQAALPTIRSRCAEIVLPGTVAAADRIAVEGVPPEIAHRGEKGEPVAELIVQARRGLAAVLEGDEGAAIRLATVLGAQENGFEIVASAACELAGEPDQEERAAACIGLAAELLHTDGLTRSLALRPVRQMLSVLLRWAHEETRP